MIELRFCEWDWVEEGVLARCKHCAKQLKMRDLKLTRNCPGPTAPVQSPTSGVACLHRGPHLRAVPCKSCNNSTIEVSVYQCALFGECTIDSHAHQNESLAGTHVCRGCPSRKAAEPALPSLPKKAINYAGAQLRDWLGGKLRRSPDLVARLFNDFCRVCPAYNAAEGACSKCGCPVSPDASREDNKLAWSQDKCPEGKWPIQRANLIFYLLPLRHPDRVWQWHVEQLRQRLSIFNGRRIVWIATKGLGTHFNLDPPDQVRAAFGADAAAIEFVEAPNNPAHWETPAFRWMLRALYTGLPVRELTRRREGAKERDAEFLRAFAASRDPSGSEASFYFHAKGVRRAVQSAIRPWCEAIYHHNLDRWPEVKQILSVYPCCGIARQPTSPITLGGPGWHFAGTGFWFNHAALFGSGSDPIFARASGASGSESGSDPFRWDNIHDHSHAVEGYLGTQFPYESAYCLAHDNAGGKFGGVYNAGTWANWRRQDRKPAIAPAGSWREPPEDLELWVLGHDSAKLRWATERSWIRKIDLRALSEKNLGESLIFHSEWPAAGTAYVGLCSQSWDRKYAGRCLPLADLDTLERRPELVWAAHPAGPDWLEESEANHPGMRAVLGELIAHLGLREDQLRRGGLWANNLICRRDVLIDLAAWHRRLLPWALARWGWVPPYDVSRHHTPHGGPGAGRELSFLAERCTVLYFCTRADLEIRPIPRGST